jgi:hypothetical protein
LPCATVQVDGGSSASAVAISESLSLVGLVVGIGSPPGQSVTTAVARRYRCEFFVQRAAAVRFGPMGAPRGQGLIDLASVQETTLGRRWQAWLATVVLALAAGCTAAPLAGKPCGCATGYYCCDASNVCVTNLATQCAAPPRCQPTKLMNPVITQDGGPDQSPDAGTDAVQFGVSTEQWGSYTYPVSSSDQAMLTMTPDGDGFRVTAIVTSAYAGVGLSFVSVDGCVDGTDYAGVQFEFNGTTAGHVVRFIVMANDDVFQQDDMRGTCTNGSNLCYGPWANVDPTMTPNKVAFDSLHSGFPDEVLDPQHIIKLQWEVQDNGTTSEADFTISNVQFYR